MGMMIDNHEIEFAFEKEVYSDGDIHHYHTLKFVKTPRGRRKQLMFVEEVFEAGRLEEVQFDFSGAKNAQERRKLISSLLRGAFRPKTRFDNETLFMLKASWISATETMFLRFA